MRPDPKLTRIGNPSKFPWLSNPRILTRFTFTIVTIGLIPILVKVALVFVRRINSTS